MNLFNTSKRLSPRYYLSTDAILGSSRVWHFLL